MGNTQNNAPDLEERFLEPEGWRWHSFTRPTQSGGRKIRFGSVFPKDSVPDAVVVCLPGLSEFSEKYYEMSREEIQHMWMKKLNHLWNFNMNFYFKKGLTSSYNWYWAHLGQPPFGLHVTMFKDSIETFCDDE